MGGEGGEGREGGFSEVGWQEPQASLTCLLPILGVEVDPQSSA